MTYLSLMSSTHSCKSSRYVHVIAMLAISASDDSLLQGVEFLHSHQIAHLVSLSADLWRITRMPCTQDVCTENIMRSSDRDKVNDRRFEAGKVYIIDFHTSRQLCLPPGKQPAILLPPSQVKKPQGITHLDPYSWDIYCLGNEVFRRRLQVTKIRTASHRDFVLIRFSHQHSIMHPIISGKRSRGS